MLRQLLVILVFALTLSADVLARPGDIGADWTLSTPDGVAVHLDDVVGEQATVLLFWATWCPYCKALMPHLQSMRLEYGTDVRILAINVFEDGDPVAVIEDAGYDFTLLLDGDIEAGEYGITGTPGVIILDKDRMIRFDLRALPRIEPPATVNTTGTRQKAAFRAPYWAAEIRKSLDAVIADVYTPKQQD